MQSWIIAALLLSGVSGIRKHRRGQINVNVTEDLEAQSTRGQINVNVTEDLEAQSTRGQVKGLYTFGAPKVSAPALTNPLSGDGCFPGYRIVNKNEGLIYDVDIVPSLMKTLPYAHPKIDIEFLDQRSKRSRPCGWTGMTYERPGISLHDLDMYVSRTVSLLPGIRSAAEVGVAVSYEHDARKAASFVGRFGYRLVGTALVRREASHLIQHARTGDCILTFEGSDEFSDWLENINIIQRSFCGLKEKVHSGFKTAVMNMVATSQFNTGVREKLGHCRSVDVAGHSRGGAISYLFTACAHNTVRQGSSGYDEWKHFFWNNKAMRIMPSIA